jgi:hypothetical protein
MKETTHQYALAVLKERRAEGAGEIAQLESGFVTSATRWFISTAR